MSFLCRDSIQRMVSPSGLKPKSISLPNVDELAYVARLTAGQVDRYQEEIKKSDKALVRGTILTWALVDETNHRLFGEDGPATLAQMPADTAEIIVDAFLEANGLSRKN